MDPSSGFSVQVEIILLAVYGVILIAVAAVGPVITYLLNNITARQVREENARLLAAQTAELARGQSEIAQKVEATHELVNGAAELLRAQREQVGYDRGVEDQKAEQAQ